MAVKDKAKAKATKLQVANAKPEVVDVERRKMADAELKIKTIEEQISLLEK